MHQSALPPTDKSELKVEFFLLKYLLRENDTCTQSAVLGRSHASLATVVSFFLVFKSHKNSIEGTLARLTEQITYNTSNLLGKHECFSKQPRIHYNIT